MPRRRRQPTHKQPTTPPCTPCGHNHTEPVILSQDKLEGCFEFLKDNEYIQRGYRANMGIGRSLWSIFSWHNETMNIWTHLVGSIVAFVLLGTTIGFLSPHGTDRVLHMSQSFLNDPSVDNRCAAVAETSHSYHHEHIPHILSLVADTNGTLELTSPVHQTICLSDTAPDTRAHRFLMSVFNMTRQKMHQAEDIAFTIRDHLQRMKDSEAAPWNSPPVMNAVQTIENRLTYLKESMSSACLRCAGSLRKVEEMRQHLMAGIDEALHQISEHSAHTAQEAFEELAHKVRHLGDGVSLLHIMSPWETSHGVLKFLPRWPLTIFLISAGTCMFLSALFHTLSSVSETIQKRFQRFDYAGISLLIAGSTVPIVYYGFYCHSTLRTMYLGFVLTVGLVGFTVSVMKKYSTAAYRPFRAVLFSVMGVSGVIPLTHLFFHHGEVLGIFPVVLLVGAFYLTGATLYAMQVPERCSPGKFDHCGHSHQLFHVLVFLAVITHYYGLMEFYEWRMFKPCPAQGNSTMPFIADVLGMRQSM